jgi:hypothetical protein
VAKGGKQAAAEPAVDEAQEGEEPTHETERLIAEAPAWLGVPSHVAAGALVNSNKNVTVSEARSAVEEFLKTPVEVS